MSIQQLRNLTTLCYIEQDGKYLMLHRVKKENDINKDKWIGGGGHFEADESPEDWVLRDVKDGLPVPGNHHLFIPGRL